MKRLSVAVDPELVEKCRRLARVRTKREAIEVALREYVRARSLEELAELAGAGLVDMSLEELEDLRERGTKDA